MQVSMSAGAVLVAVLMLTSACSGDDGAGGEAVGAPDTATAVASATPSASGDAVTESAAPTDTEGGAGSSGDVAAQTMRLADQEHPLEAPSCNLPDQQDGPFRLNADTTDGKGSLLVVGVGGLGSATIEYDGVSYRSPGAEPVFEGSTVTYSGQAASGSLASDTVDFAFNVTCP